MHAKDTILLTPKNDEESLMIVKIAQAAGIPMVVSAQPHGARLEREEHLLRRLREAGPEARRVVIVEIPGPEVENELEKEGFEVVLIDHHRYNELNRMADKSSLEQFLEVFAIDDNMLAGWGFDPMLVQGVGIIDRGFLWALRAEVPDPELRKQIRDYYRALTFELGGNRPAVEEAAREAWEFRTELPGIVLVQTDREDVSIRDAVSFLVADHFDLPPQVVVVEGGRRMFVQESDHAADLFARYGGFTFGRDRCWGIQSSPERSLPVLSDILTQIAG